MILGPGGLAVAVPTAVAGHDPGQPRQRARAVGIALARRAPSRLRPSAATTGRVRASSTSCIGRRPPSRASTTCRIRTAAPSASTASRNSFSGTRTCVSSSRRPSPLSPRNTSSIRQRSRYSRTTSRACAAPLTVRLVRSRQHEGATPAGGSGSSTTTRCSPMLAGSASGSPDGRFTVTVPARRLTRAVRAGWPGRAGTTTVSVGRLPHRPALRQRPVVSGAHQKVGALRPPGEGAVQVALLIGDHRNLSRHTAERGRCRLRPGDPAQALLLVHGPAMARRDLAGRPAPDLRIQQTQNRLVGGIHRRNRMHEEARLNPVAARTQPVPARGAGKAQRARVLHHHHAPAPAGLDSPPAQRRQDRGDVALRRAQVAMRRRRPGMIPAHAAQHDAARLHDPLEQPRACVSAFPRQNQTSRPSAPIGKADTAQTG